MFQKALRRVRTQCAKYAFLTQEEIAWEDFVRVKQSGISIVADPFPHIVVDDFLQDWVYQDLLANFRNIQSRGFGADVHVHDKFHAFDIDYDGSVFIPPPTLDPKRGLALFFSLEWNMFFSRLFAQHTTFETSVAFHHHQPGDRTGFVHHDFADKSFTLGTKLANGIVPRTSAEDTDSYKRRRVIALIYFLANDGWIEGDGGEVGLYAQDKKTVRAMVAPKCNRLFAFQISPHSFHAFQQNKKERNSIVQWFHAPTDLLSKNAV